MLFQGPVGRIAVRSFLFGAAILALPPSAAAQTLTGRPTIEVARAERAPVIDGELDDRVWQRARFVSEFKQQQPIEYGEPSVLTEVAFAYDGEALYVAARMYTGGPGDVEAVMTRRDDTGAAERIIISLDTFNDRRTAYSFAVTAAGVQADWMHPDDDTGARDHSFDPVWTSDIAHRDDRWTAEMRIPFSQLRFPEGNEHRWGVNLNRFIPHKNEDIFWIVPPKDEKGWSSYFGELRGVREVETGRRIELLPYAAGDVEVTSPALVDDDDPFASELDLGARAGLDAKLGLGPSLTLDATINPDFGQVEADPAVVNLTAFETTFEERRPFFVEGQQLLIGNGPAYYYSRRIGAAPRGAVDADYADLPTSTRILGAAKLTGRLPSRLSIGALTALTQDIDVRTYDLATDMRATVPVEPLTSYNVLRLEQELGESSSRVGASLTGVYRHFDGSSPLASQFSRYATAGGADWSIRLDQARYEIGGSVGFSALGGEPAAIADLQQASAHYFQRPDADHVELDPDRDSLLGWTSSFGGGRRSGAWRWNLAGWAESPGFAINDLGVLHTADDVGGSGIVTYTDSAPGSSLHSWDVSASGLQEWNFGGDRDPASVETNGGVTFRNFWRLGGRLRLGLPGFDDRATRGGPLLGVGWAHAGSVSLSNAFAARTRWSAQLEWDVHQTGVTGTISQVSVTMRPVDSVQLSLSPRYVHRSDNRQYVDTIEGAGGPTFGRRYLFATVDRRELSLQARLQVAFTPDLTVELFAQPFASSGAFRQFGELPAPGSRTLRIYDDINEMDGTYTVTADGNSFSFDDPDFTLLSLRSTLVVRWELAPGSTLFAVWQQNRAETLDRAAALDHAGDGFTAAGRNVLAIKLSYWLPF